MKTLQQKFKELYKTQIKPRLDKIDKLSSEIDKHDSERYRLSSDINKLSSEIHKLFSKRNKLLSEKNKLFSERYRLSSERDRLNSEIYCAFYRFEKENNCIVRSKDYNFNLSDIEVKPKEEKKWMKIK